MLVGESNIAGTNILTESVRFLCPKCRQTLSAEASLVGHKAKCPKCDQVLLVPTHGDTQRIVDRLPHGLEAKQPLHSALSTAQLLFLSKFKHPRAPEEFPDDSYWTPVLGETPHQAIQRLVNHGLLSAPDLIGRLTYKFTLPELKQLLRERKLLVSGRKSELVTRLTQADPEGMKQSISQLIVFQQSDPGRDLSERFQAAEEAKRRQVEHQVLQALQERDFEAASKLVASYEAQQPFLRGVNIDWRHYDHATTVTFLNSIFTCKPTILARVNDSQLGQLRLAAAMMHLWGTRDAQLWLIRVMRILFRGCPGS